MLRLRLMLCYAGTFGLILLLLGGGLFLVIRSQVSQRLDASLADATAALERAAEIREIESTKASGDVVDAVDELHIPDRPLYLLDSSGTPVKPAHAEPWVLAAARAAIEIVTVHAARGGRIERAHVLEHAQRDGGVRRREPPRCDEPDRLRSGKPERLDRSRRAGAA